MGGEVFLSHQSEEFSVLYHGGAIEHRAGVCHRGSHDNNCICPRAIGEQVLHGLFGCLQQHLLVEEVQASICRYAEFGEADYRRTFLFGLCDEVKHLLQIIGAVSYTYARYGSCHLDESEILVHSTECVGWGKGLFFATFQKHHVFYVLGVREHVYGLNARYVVVSVQ